ncbi:MAG: radical SAM protein [Bilophila sp.]
MPFAGCPHRCLFCAQDKQTGVHHAASSSLDLTILKDLEACLSALRTRTPMSCPVELAFYGGTFTALPVSLQMACLKAVHLAREEGLVCRVRCSTRPDALDLEHLCRLREAGLHLIEVGVQSFDDAALIKVRRGYTSETARAGCLRVLEAGLELGIQLLPGMPGSTPAVFLHDVDTALALSPSCLRLYPCLVVDGTPLAALWRAGAYQPWDLATTLTTLAEALTRTWVKEIPVIRLSLAPEPELEAALLAGPRHPALGERIQGEALLGAVAAHLATTTRPPDAVYLPAFCQGFFFGHKGDLRPRWRKLGIDPSAVHWISGTQGKLLWEKSAGKETSEAVGRLAE